MRGDRYEVRVPSRWRWVRRVGLSVAISLFTYFAVQLGEREWTKREGERELAAVRAGVESDDPDWTWEGVNAVRRPAPEGRNGADLIPRVKALMHPDWGKASGDRRWAAAPDAEPNRRLPPELLAAVRADLAASSDALALARTMKERPWGRRDIALTPNVLDTLLADTQNTRHVADLLRWDAAVAAEDGDRERAAADLLALLRTSRSIGDEPFLISQLVRMATRTITVRAAARVVAQADAAGLAELQAALADDAEEPLLLYGARGDRAAFDRLFEGLISGAATPGRALDPGFGDTQARVGWWHYRPNLLADRAYALGWMTQWVAAARLPVHEQAAACAAVPVPPQEPSRMLSRLLLPAVDRVSQAHWRSVGEARCAVAGLACERFRQQHGRFPNALTDLVPAYLTAVPLDPYTGEPLRFAKLDRGAVVYSVGADRRGAGDLDPPPDPANQQPRFRLWNPDQRRLPPTEPPPAEPKP